MSDGGRSLATAVIITVAGVIPLALMLSASGQDREEPEVPSPPPTTAPAEVVREPVVVTTPPPTLDGVSTEVARVLASNGFVSEEEVAGLPESVSAVLQERNVTLTVAVEPED